jgi:hypothetical protein
MAVGGSVVFLVEITINNCFIFFEITKFICMFFLIIIILLKLKWILDLQMRKNKKN